MAIIGVMGSGSIEWNKFAEPLGIWIALEGYDLLTGAGNGVMLSVSRAFSQTKGRTGRAIGIVPTRVDDMRGFVALDGYPNPYIDMAIISPLPRRDPHVTEASLSRNYINILTSDVVIALPGGEGTLDEVRLAKRFHKPILCFGPSNSFQQMPKTITMTDNLEVVCHFINGATAALSDNAAEPQS